MAIAAVYFFKPHYSTAYVDVAYCYRQSTMGLSGGLSVIHDCEHRKND